jgi:hypothetical protein
MAFQAAAGHNSLPNGNFSATIFSKKAQKAYRRKAVVQAITNSDYFGEISNHGDTVRIIKEPEITVKEYSRGTNITAQDLDDEDFTLTIDKANYFAFKIDDIEERHSHINWESLASDRAGFKMADQQDLEVIGYMSGFKSSAIGSVASTARVAADKSGTDPMTVDADGLLASMKLTRGSFSSNFATSGTASHSIPVGPNPVAGTSDFASPLQILNRMKRLLDVQNVPEDGRWLLVDPVFLEILGDENSKLMDHDFTSTSESLLRNGRVGEGLIRGFKLYTSNGMPAIGSGPGTSGTTSQVNNYGVLLAGCNSAVATASQIDKTEQYRDPDSFADVVRGMQLYGRKILRPESLVRAIYNLA